MQVRFRACSREGGPAPPSGHCRSNVSVWMFGAYYMWLYTLLYFRLRLSVFCFFLSRLRQWGRCLCQTLSQTRLLSVPHTAVRAGNETLVALPATTPSSHRPNVGTGRPWPGGDPLWAEGLTSRLGSTSQAGGPGPQSPGLGLLPASDRGSVAVGGGGAASPSPG